MNRSLLLVVCDFLLLSILALARFDVPKDAVIAQDDQKVVSKEVVERISDGENYDDVVAELEATNETLLENLSSDKNDLVEQKLKLEAEIAQRQKELEQKELEIASKDAVIEGNEEALDLAKKEAQQLEAQRLEIERKREELLQSNAASKKELELLAKNLEQAKKKSEELAEMKSKKEKEAEAARLELAASVERAKAQELAASEAKALLIEEKKRSDELLASAAKIDQKIDTLNKGLDGVGQDLKSVGEGLAGVGEKISTVSQDVQESVEVQKENFRKLNERQTRSVNEIFTRYEENKVNLELTFSHKFGITQSAREDKFSVDTILMVDGNFVYALVHAKDSPFRVEFNPRRLVSVTGTISGDRLSKPLEVKEIAFMDDPRILIVPLYANPQELTKSGLELFQAPQNPFLFDDAVVVDVKDSRFGQTKCLRDEKDGRYIEVDEKHFAFLTGAFNPGKGDLVFSQKAELLGIMVNGDYAFHVKNLGSRIEGGSRTLLGSSFQAEKTNTLLRELNKNLSGLNKKFKY
jgi:hypothetical protein